MEKMYDRKKNRMVEVFSIDALRKIAVIYDPQIASKSPGNGWQEIPLKRLIPDEWVDMEIGDFVSKTEKSNAKRLLTLCDGLWKTEDNQVFVCLDNAVSHQLKLMREEK